MRSSHLCTASMVAALSIVGLTGAAHAVTPTISGASWNGFSPTGRRLTITGSFPAVSCPNPLPGRAYFWPGSCYTVEVTCNGALIPGRITAMTSAKISIEVPELPSGARCSVAVAANDGTPQATTIDFYLGAPPSPPIEIHSTVDLGVVGGQQRYRLLGNFPANGNFGVTVACDGQSVAASVTSQVLDQLEIQFTSASGSRSCLFAAQRPLDGAVTPVWYQRVGGAKTGSTAMPQFVGTYHWGGFVPDWANRLDSPRVAVQRIRDAGLIGPVRFSLSPKQLRSAGNNSANSTRFDWYDDYAHTFDVDPACDPGVGLGPFLASAVCSRRLQAAFDALPVFSTIFLTTMDATSAGPYEWDTHYRDYAWMATAHNWDAVRNEYYQLARQLHLSQAGSAKTFVITNWEADNLIHCGNVYATVLQFETQGTLFCPGYLDHRDALLLWFAARQDGIRDAAAEFAGSGVTVVDGIEIASYRMIHGSGLPTGGAAGADALHGIVQFIRPTYVLYSAWDTTGNGRVDQDVRELSQWLAVHSPGSTLALGEYGRPGQAGSSALDTWIFREMMAAARRAADLGPQPDRAWMRFAITWQSHRTIDENQQLFTLEGGETAALRAAYVGARTAPGPAGNGDILAIREVRQNLADCTRGGAVAVPSCEATVCELLDDVRGGTTRRYFELYGTFPSPGTSYAVQAYCADSTLSAVPSPGSWNTVGNIIAPMSSGQITLWISEPSVHRERWCVFRTAHGGVTGQWFGPIRSPANSPCNGKTLAP